MRHTVKNNAITAWVLMTVYEADQAQALDKALESIFINQSQHPDGAVIVMDGPVGEELYHVVNHYRRTSNFPVKVIQLLENKGLSLALNEGLKAIPEDVTYVVRHDADDLSRRDRLRYQIDYMEKNVDVGIASGQVSIFEGSPENPVGSRYLPVGIDLQDYARWRTPINHSCSIIRTTALSDVRDDYPDTRLPFEDWWLSLRLSKRGWTIEAIDRVQMDFRGGAAMIARRRGYHYVKKEISFFRHIISEGLMSRRDAVLNLLVRTPARLMPGIIGRTIYRVALHRKLNKGRKMPAHASSKTS